VGDLVGHNAHVLFEKRLQAGLLDGSVRVAFRRWRRAQVVAGRRYRSPIGLVEIDAVSQVPEDEVCGEDALAAGYGSVADLLRDLKGPQDAALFRLELRRSGDADPRNVLAEDGLLDDEHLRELDKRLARLDALRGRPWTRATLEAIEAEPGRRAGDLAPQLGWDELHDFKLHVRKLKALGLTHSLRIGYELSPRGAAYLQRSR
jgi:hypothetical protein